jgi:putative mRNA 3-end processing factor
MKNLIEFTDRGLYCPPADVFIDPWQPVDRAIITHAHSDHSRWGMKYYLAHRQSEQIMRLRLGQDIRLETLEYNEAVDINGVEVSLHPAGHIFGSAQVKLTYRGETWVASGDYKLEDDGFTVPFAPVRCHTFITESTFGLPIYRWQPQVEIMQDINDWWRGNQAQGKASLIGAYALGKAQRIIDGVDRNIGPILVHGAVANVNEALIAGGAKLPALERVSASTTKETIARSLIIAPSSAFNSLWVNKLKPYRLGIASGWMNIRGAKRRRAADRGFVLSDHADWPGLNQAIAETGAERVYVTHGFTAAFSRWLREQGYESAEVKTSYEGELSEISESADDLK